MYRIKTRGPSYCNKARKRTAQEENFNNEKIQQNPMLYHLPQEDVPIHLISPMRFHLFKIATISQ